MPSLRGSVVGGGSRTCSRCETAGIDLAPCSRFRPLGMAELVVTREQALREGPGKDAARGCLAGASGRRQEQEKGSFNPKPGPTSPAHRCPCLGCTVSFGSSVKHWHSSPPLRPTAPHNLSPKGSCFSPPSSRSRAARTCHLPLLEHTRLFPLHVSPQHISCDHEC